jgi:hypothetical protein
MADVNPYYSFIERNENGIDKVNKLFRNEEEMRGYLILKGLDIADYEVVIAYYSDDEVVHDTDFRVSIPLYKPKKEQ